MGSTGRRVPWPGRSPWVLALLLAISLAIGLIALSTDPLQTSFWFLLALLAMPLLAWVKGRRVTGTLWAGLLTGGLLSAVIGVLYLLVKNPPELPLAHGLFAAGGILLTSGLWLESRERGWD